MKITLIEISKLLVSYLYKWVLPVIASIFFLVFADQEKSFLIRFILWFLLCLAYISIPMNFEMPKKKVYYFFLEMKPLAILVAITQSLALGLGVYGLTIISLNMYFYLPETVNYIISILNALLYLLTMFLEYSLLKIKAQ